MYAKLVKVALALFVAFAPFTAHALNYQQCAEKPLYDRNDCYRAVDICFEIVLNARVVFNAVARGTDRDLIIYALTSSPPRMEKQDAEFLVDQVTEVLRPDGKYDPEKYNPDEFARPLQNKCLESYGLETVRPQINW